MTVSKTQNFCWDPCKNKIRQVKFCYKADFYEIHFFAEKTIFILTTTFKKTVFVKNDNKLHYPFENDKIEKVFVYFDADYNVDGDEQEKCRGGSDQPDVFRNQCVCL